VRVGRRFERVRVLQLEHAPGHRLYHVRVPLLEPIRLISFGSYLQTKLYQLDVD
jgi:hypothetical protein